MDVGKLKNKNLLSLFFDFIKKIYLFLFLFNSVFISVNIYGLILLPLK